PFSAQYSDDQISPAARACLPFFLAASALEMPIRPAPIPALAASRTARRATSSLSVMFTLPCAHASRRALLVQRRKRRRQLLAVLGIRIDLLQPVHQVDVFGAELLLELIELLAELLQLVGVLGFRRLLHLRVDLAGLAIDLNLGLVRAHDPDNLLHVGDG